MTVAMGRKCCIVMTMRTISYAEPRLPDACGSSGWGSRLSDATADLDRETGSGSDHLPPLGSRGGHLAIGPCGIRLTG